MTDSGHPTESGNRVERDHALGGVRDNRHRITVEFGGGYAPSIVKIVHPPECAKAFCEKCEHEGGPDACDGQHTPCWAETWIDNMGDELLNGTIEMVVEPEWNGVGVDSGDLHIVGASMPGERDELREAASEVLRIADRDTEPFNRLRKLLGA